MQIEQQSSSAPETRPWRRVLGRFICFPGIPALVLLAHLLAFGVFQRIIVTELLGERAYQAGVRFSLKQHTFTNGDPLPGWVGVTLVPIMLLDVLVLAATYICAARVAGEDLLGWAGLPPGRGRSANRTRMPPLESTLPEKFRHLAGDADPRDGR
jgi:hypothetical protein